MITISRIKKYLRGCSDHRDQLFCLFLIKKASLALRMESRLEKTFSMGMEMFCGCGRFKFVVRVIYGTAVFIKSVF